MSRLISRYFDAACLARQARRRQAWGVQGSGAEEAGMGSERFRLRMTGEVADFRRLVKALGLGSNA